MTREDTERRWFRRVVIVMMLVGISFGAVPVVKNFMFPAPKRADVQGSLTFASAGHHADAAFTVH